MTLPACQRANNCRQTFSSARRSALTSTTHMLICPGAPGRPQIRLYLPGLAQGADDTNDGPPGTPGPSSTPPRPQVTSAYASLTSQQASKHWCWQCLCASVLRRRLARLRKTRMQRAMMPFVAFGSTPAVNYNQRLYRQASTAAVLQATAPPKRASTRHESSSCSSQAMSNQLTLFYTGFSTTTNIRLQHAN